MDLETLKTWTDWVDHIDNPLIHPEPPDWIIADPTFIPPTASPDDDWHLFAHGILSGINHFISDDGFKWKNTESTFSGGIRPYLHQEGDMYYLIFEKTFTPLFGSISISQSSDLYDWSEPVTILAPSQSWEGRISRSVGNPCLIKVNNIFRLYYSAGSVMLWDTMVYEPKYIGVAASKNIMGPYKKSPKPIIRPSEEHKYRNLGAGAIKVLKMNDMWVGFNNGIYKDDNERSRSSILLMHSKDGLKWKDVFNTPIIYPTQGWKKGFVYQCDVRKVGDEYWLYYNARNGWVRASEKIGLAILDL
jgi:hypothetical protein